MCTSRPLRVGCLLLLFLAIVAIITAPVYSVLVSFGPRSGELRTQKLKSHLVRTQSLNVFPLKLE